MANSTAPELEWRGEARKVSWSVRRHWGELRRLVSPFQFHYRTVLGCRPSGARDVVALAGADNLLETGQKQTQAPPKLEKRPLHNCRLWGSMPSPSICEALQGFISGDSQDLLGRP